MKHKNILLVVFFLTLFVFQQVQASTIIPPVKNPYSINAAPARTGVLLDYVNVYMYMLQPNTGGFLNNTPSRCEWPLNFGIYGCGDDYNDFYLVDPGSYMTVVIEDVGAGKDYLRDVIATEMNLAEITPNLEALKAQAIASRTVASWKYVHGPWDAGDGIPTDVNTGAINNTARYQAFAPGAYRKSGYKTDMDTATGDTNDQFLQYEIGIYHAIDAEFFADVESATEDGDVSAPYLKGVADPISVGGCVLPDLGTNKSGMSQRGAIRWAKGNTCPDGTGEV